MPHTDQNAAARPFLLALTVLCTALALAWWLLRVPEPPAPSDLEGSHDAGPVTAPTGGALTAERDGPGADPQAERDFSDFRSTTPAMVSGLVTDERGAGLRGATVALFPVDPQGMRGAPYPDGARLDGTTTDADGAFALKAEVSGWLRVVASATGRATVAERIPGPGVRIVLRLPRAAALTVRVRDGEGKPVAGAAVQARIEASVLDQRSDGEGTAEFPTLPPGGVRVRVSADGYGAVVAGPYVVRSDERAEALIVLPPGVPLGGVVVDDATNAPVAEADVYVAHPGHADRAAPTGPDGRFGPVPGGGVGERVFLAAHADGYAPLLQPVVLAAADGGMTVVLRLQAAPPWRGTVVAPDGRPAAGATVGYTASGVAGLGPAGTTADADGRFALPPPPPPAPGRRVVLHARQGEARAALALRPGSLAPDPLVLRLRDDGRVAGRVVDAAGSPMAGVQVRLTPAWDEVGNRGQPDAATSRLLLSNEQGLAGLAAASDAQGRWVARSIPAGPYHVRFRWPGGSHWRADVLDVAGAHSDAGTETLGAGGQLSGRVTDRSGRALAGAELRLAPAGAPRRAQRAVSGSDGWYEFRGLAAGAYGLRVSYGNLPDLREAVEIRGDTEQRVDPQFDPGAVLEGRVGTPAGKPYGGVLTLTLRRDGSTRPDRPPFGVLVRQGRFRIEAVQIGRWIVEARAPGGLRAEARAIEVDADRTTPIALTLENSRAVRGLVRTAGGKPVPGAELGLRHEATNRRHLTTADAEGRFFFADLAAGTWVVEFSGRGGAPNQETFSVEDVQARPLLLTLQPAGAVRVHVRDAQGRPVAQALLTFRTAEGAMATRTPTRTDRAGMGLGRDLPVGTLVVTARTLDGLSGQAQVTTREGDTTDLDVQVAPRDDR